MRSAASTENLDPEALTERARAIPPMAGQEFVDRVTTAQPFRWHQDQVHPWSPEERKSPWNPDGSGFKVVVFDYGVKYNILRNLEQRGCQVLVVPALTPAGKSWP